MPEAFHAESAAPVPALTFTEAARLGFRNFLVFKGRARRSEYWWFLLLYATPGLAIAGVAALNDQPGAGPILDAVNIIYWLALLVPYTAVAIRRMHDTGRVSWWLLVGLVPVVGWAAYFWLLGQKGSIGPNRFGPDPIVPAPQARP
jgi:uncharacterized membrane protein YhaH (DUF805 family)